MAIKGVEFKWYDGFFLSMLATSIIIVAISWKRYHSRTHPLHIWIVRYKRFYGRIVVSSILVLLLYPFLLAWTVIGTLWFTRSKDCLPEDGQKWGFLIWLLFSYCGLVCIACLCLGKVPLGEVRCRNRLKTSHSASNSEKLVTLLTLTELSHYYENRLILFRNEALLRQLLL